MSTQKSTTWLLIALSASIVFLGGCQSALRTDSLTHSEITYEIDITGPADDLFHVTVTTRNLGPDNAVYNMAATAPGTYSILDLGRFVKDFKAFDGEGRELPTERLSTNRWRIDHPELLAVLRYDVEDTYDSKMSENSVAPMSGSGIDSTYAAFNTFSVVGYFEGLQSNPVRMKVRHDPDWKIACAMDTDPDGFYVAETFDRLADSPVLVGRVSVAETKVNDIDVEVYVFAPDTAVTAGKVLALADDVLQSAGEFIGSSPVPHYKFLMVLLDGPTFERYGLTSAGALEHSYSSLYVIPTSAEDLPELRSTMAHEFMHILTPLNLHSEIIHSYNFAEPTPSEHLWLYEGVTEWVSDIMQLRSGLISTEEYLAQVSQKLRTNDGFDKNMSLTEMALTVYNAKGGRQFGNVYSRGAVTAAYLDIRLLELSNGKRGLRELFLDLLDEYGPQRPFPEKRFFDVVTAKTYPEIGQFIEDYLRGSKPLPTQEYMEKLGFRYILQQPSKDTIPTFGVPITLNENREIVVQSIPVGSEESGLREGDVLLKVFGTELTLENAREMFRRTQTMKIGDPYEVVVRRNGQELAVTGKLLRRMSRHVFEDNGSLTTEQKSLRDRWLRNHF